MSDAIDPRLELERMIRTILDEQGPSDFSRLYFSIRGISIQPGTLHDALNNMIGAGLVQISRSGFYSRCE